MQTQFARKPKIVSGWQLPFWEAHTPAPPWEDVPHPGWLQEGLQRGVLRLESFPSIEHWVIKATLPEKKVIYCYPGSWITCDEDGALMSRKPEEIESDWEALPV